MQCRRANGYTIMELMLTIAVIAILATVAVPSYQQYILRIKNAKAATDLAAIVALIETYRVGNNNAIPATLATTEDPWGNAYVYAPFSGIRGVGAKRKDRNLVPINSEYDLYSKGADGKSVSPLTASVSRDDIIVANDGKFIGIASNY